MRRRIHVRVRVWEGRVGDRMSDIYIYIYNIIYMCI